MSCAVVAGAAGAAARRPPPGRARGLTPRASLTRPGLPPGAVALVGISSEKTTCTNTGRRSRHRLLFRYIKLLRSHHCRDSMHRSMISTPGIYSTRSHGQSSKVDGESARKTTTHRRGFHSQGGAAAQLRPVLLPHPDHLGTLLSNNQMCRQKLREKTRGR